MFKSYSIIRYTYKCTRYPYIYIMHVEMVAIKQPFCQLMVCFYDGIHTNCLVCYPTQSTITCLYNSSSPPLPPTNVKSTFILLGMRASVCLQSLLFHLTPNHLITTIFMSHFFSLHFLWALTHNLSYSLLPLKPLPKPRG